MTAGSPAGREVSVRPDDLAAAGRAIRSAVRDMPAALDRFTRLAVATPDDFGTTGPDQQVGQAFGHLCSAVQDLWPMIYDKIDATGTAVDRWASAFAANDRAAAEALARLQARLDGH